MILQQSMPELTALRDSVEDRCNDVASEAIAAEDSMGDCFLATAEVYGWFPTRAEGRKQRERRALWRDVATQNELPEKEEDVRSLKNADGIGTEDLETAKHELQDAEMISSKADGIHVPSIQGCAGQVWHLKNCLFWACLHRQILQAPLHATHSRSH